MAGPIASFPMDREAAEEEIALLVRKPGFDEMTPADIVRHMNNRFNINFDSYRAQLKTMTLEEIRKRNEENSSGSSDDESDTDDERNKKDAEEVKKPKEKKVVVEEAHAKDTEKVKPDVESDSDSDTGVEDATPVSKKGRKKAVQDDMVSNVKSSRRAAASNAMKQIRNTSEGGRFKSSKAKKEKDPNEDNSGRFGRMTKLCYISPELQAVTGDQFMKRCDVVKALWDYIKANNLKDPKAGQYFLCDELLEPVFKKKRVKAFGMTKWLTKHVIGTNDMPAELREECEQEMEKRRAEWTARKRQREAEQISSANSSEGPSIKKVKEDDDPEEDEGDEEKDAGGSSDSD